MQLGGLHRLEGLCNTRLSEFQPTKIELNSNCTSQIHGITVPLYNGSTVNCSLSSMKPTYVLFRALYNKKN